MLIFRSLMASSVISQQTYEHTHKINSAISVDYTYTYDYEYHIQTAFTNITTGTLRHRCVYKCSNIYIVYNIHKYIIYIYIYLQLAPTLRPALFKSVPKLIDYVHRLKLNKDISCLCQLLWCSSAKFYIYIHIYTYITM